MGKKRRIDPETRARWEELTQQTLAHIERLNARIDADRERKERRRRRLHRLSFGLLGR